MVRGRAVGKGLVQSSTSLAAYPTVKNIVTVQKGGYQETASPAKYTGLALFWEKMDSAREN
jgi:hypothetical protein